MQAPAVVEDKDAVPGHFARSVVIGFNDRQACGVLYIISLVIMNIERDLDSVLARNQREARDFANKDLPAHSLPPGVLGLEEAMRCENPLPKQAVKSQAGIKARCGFFQFEVYVGFERATHPQTVSQRSTFICKEFEPFQ